MLCPLLSRKRQQRKQLSAEYSERMSVGHCCPASGARAKQRPAAAVPLLVKVGKDSHGWPSLSRPGAFSVQARGRVQKPKAPAPCPHGGQGAAGESSTQQEP